MKTSEFLDAILRVYLEIWDTDKKVFFANVVETIDANISVDKLDMLYHKLTDDGYLKDGPYKSRAEDLVITSAGILFLEQGGYTKQVERIKQKDDLVNKRLDEIQRNKVLSFISLFIAICAIILSILSLIKWW